VTSQACTGHVAFAFALAAQPRSGEGVGGGDKKISQLIVPSSHFGRWNFRLPCNLSRRELRCLQKKQLSLVVPAVAL